MFSVVRGVIWNIRLKGWSYVKNYAGIAAAVGIVWGGGWYGVYRTRHALNNIVVWRALDRERSGAPEYLYYNDPAHEQTLLQLFQDKGWSIWPYIGKFARKWRRAVLQRLIEVARDGEAEERIRALRLIKHMKLLKDWEVCWVSQRLDASSAVRLARMGAGPRLLGAPPLPPHLRSLTPHAPLTCMAQLDPDHQCLNSFLQKHTDTHQEVQQLMDSEGSSQRGPPDKEEEIREALSATLHHLSGGTGTNGAAAQMFVQEGGLALLCAAVRTSERDLHLAAARLLLCLSSQPSLLPLIHRAGLIQCLANWLEGTDAELSSLAGGTLAGLEGERWGTGEVYGLTVQLLHPTHLTKLPPKLDVVTVHGLLGEPFVTWRQRDDINELTDTLRLIPTEDNNESTNEDDDDPIEREFEFVLRDLPEASIRDTGNTMFTHRGEKGIDIQERQELRERTLCWPRDWLPRDCPSIRVLGVSYDTVMTEWSEGECMAECGGLEKRARVLSEGLRKAGVGSRPILWIAHSMGGLLVKQILVHSLESDDDKRALADSTWGMIFYSTPHHGTRAAHALLWPSKEVQDLREDSNVLKKLHSGWLSGGWRCVCIAEGRPTKLMAGLPRLMLVPPTSADAGTGPCYILPLNHLDICKPATRRSFIYRQAMEMVRHALGERCRPGGCTECEHIGRVEDNYYTALYKRIRHKIVEVLTGHTMQHSENKPKDPTKDASLQSWLLGIMPF